MLSVTLPEVSRLDVTSSETVKGDWVEPVAGRGGGAVVALPWVMVPIVVILRTLSLVISFSLSFVSPQMRSYVRSPFDDFLTLWIVAVRHSLDCLR
jgi:hypothetical protein